MDIRTELGLRCTINLCGVPSAFGAGSGCPEAILAASRILPLAVDMLDLQRCASRSISLATGAAAGCVTGCAAAGISVSVAACLTGRNLDAVRSLPDRSLARHKILVQRDHDSSCGAPLRQIVEVTGAKLTHIGDSPYCTERELEAALDSSVAASMYVLSVGETEGSSVSLKRFIEISHSKQIPVICDAAPELDLRTPVALGADLVIFSAQKILGGLTAGIIAGREDLVGACLLQERGIGRMMKAGKEAVVGAVAALRRWSSIDHQALGRDWQAKLDMLERGLAVVPCISHAQVEDPYGRGFKRLHIEVDPAISGLTAASLATYLRHSNPAVIVWPYDLDRGLIILDARCATAEDVNLAIDAIRRGLSTRISRRQEATPPPIGHDAIDLEFLAWPGRLADDLKAI